MVLIEIVTIVALAIGVIIAYMFFPAFRIVAYIAGILALVILFYKFMVKKYDDYERAIIFRFGRFNRIAGPGWSVVLPFIEKEQSRVDVRTKMINIQVPVAFTKDDLRIKMDGIVYYRITDPNKAILKIDNYMIGLTNMIMSESRNLMATLTMRDLFSGLDELNNLLADRIRHATWQWGIDVPMVQIRSIMPPEEIAVAMQQKEISAQLLQAQKFKAEARKVLIEAIGEAGKKLDDKSVMYLYIKALEKMSQGSATKIIFPMQFMDIMKGGFGLGTGLGAAGLNTDDVVNSITKKLTG
jgi:regulator of protease activity HflC (stomatin/prohibitin superfamily)